MCFPTYQYIYNKTLKDGTSVLNKTPTLSAFQAPYWAIIYVLSMSLGDFNFVDMIMEPFIDDNPLTLHFPLVTVAVFVVFLLLAPMMLTNLLASPDLGQYPYYLLHLTSCDWKWAFLTRPAKVNNRYINRYVYIW